MHGSWSVKEWITKRLSGRSKTDGIILILIGILVLIILIPTGDGKKTGNVDQLTQEETDGKNTAEMRQTQTDTEYTKALEEQLTDLIESMDGVGKVRVMLTLSDDGLVYLDKDVRIQEKTREETTVVYDMGDTKEPYVVRRERPKVEGVVVVAQGGDRPGIATEIIGAIQSLFDLEAHKVKVVKMSVQEESL